MAFNFPNSPALNDTYTQGGVTYRYDGEAWTRDNVTVDIPSTTNDITEGTNLYYTDTRVDTRNENTAVYWTPATGTGPGGIIYDHSVDGDLTSADSIVLPDLEQGYEYMIEYDGLLAENPGDLTDNFVGILIDFYIIENSTYYENFTTSGRPSGYEAARFTFWNPRDTTKAIKFYQIYSYRFGPFHETIDPGTDTVTIKNFRLRPNPADSAIVKSGKFYFYRRANAL